jgi:hypothetical protein
MRRLEAFRPISEAVLEEDLSYETCVDFVLVSGLEVMLAGY